MSFYRLWLGIPESIPDSQLENVVDSNLSDIGGSMQSEEILACQRLGETDRRTKLEMTINSFR